MANPQKDEVSVEVDGRTYTLVFNFSAMVAAESKAEAIGLKHTTWEQIFEQVQSTRSARYIRLIIWAMLIKYHPDMSLEQAGQLIDSLTIQELSHVFASGQNAVTPDPKDAAALGAPSKRPRKARAVNGTGARSTSSHAGLA